MAGFIHVQGSSFDHIELDVYSNGFCIASKVVTYAFLHRFVKSYLHGYDVDTGRPLTICEIVSRTSNHQIRATLAHTAAQNGLTFSDMSG